MKNIFLFGIIFSCFNILMAQTGPVAVNDTYNLSDTVVTSILNVLANDSDIQNQSLFIAKVITTDNTWE